MVQEWRRAPVAERRVAERRVADERDGASQSFLQPHKATKLLMLFDIRGTLGAAISRVMQGGGAGACTHATGEIGDRSSLGQAANLAPERGVI